MEAIIYMSELLEHLKLDKKGEIGVYKILIQDFVSSEYWARVEEIVRDYTKIHPMEMEITVRQNNLKKTGAFTKWGESKIRGGSELRLGMSMPLLLMKTLEEFDPEIFINPKKRHKFGEKYKGFCTYAGK